MSDDYPGGWFGETWNAPVNESSRHLPTPVGDLCESCAQEITATDRGMLIPIAGMRAGVNVLGAWHLDCFLKNLGGVRPSKDPATSGK